MASPQPRIGVVTYPGSQDDRDALWALAAIDAQSVAVWHEERQLPDLDAVVVPGGFSYGDYLRCGAIARFSPVTAAIVEFANAGGLVLGICNGFQILCEAGLLPGALLRNASLRFVCRDVAARGRARRHAVHHALQRRPDDRHPGQARRRPLRPARRTSIRRRSCFRYVEDCNGSVDDIAGVCNATGNVVGLMPHPEHAVDPLLGSADGALIFASLVESCAHARSRRSRLEPSASAGCSRLEASAKPPTPGRKTASRPGSRDPELPRARDAGTRGFAAVQRPARGA